MSSPQNIRPTEQDSAVEQLAKDAGEGVNADENGWSDETGERVEQLAKDAGDGLPR